jgi:uncharacterized Zn-finger protein
MDASDSQWTGHDYPAWPGYSRWPPDESAPQEEHPEFARTLPEQLYASSYYLPPVPSYAHTHSRVQYSSSSGSDPNAYASRPDYALPPPPPVAAENEPWSPYNPRLPGIEEYASPYTIPPLPYSAASTDVAVSTAYAPLSTSSPLTKRTQFFDEALNSDSYPSPVYIASPSLPEPFATEKPPLPPAVGKRQYTCDQPDCTARPFTRVADLNRHKSTIHAEKKFGCELQKCPKVFSRRDHLMEHMRSYHRVDIKKRPPGERSIPSVSGASTEANPPIEPNPPLGAEEPLSDRDRSHPGAHTCTQCGKSFVRAGDLRKHEKVHMASKDREHRCDVCGRAFLYPKDLERHKRTQHPSEDTPAFFCPVQGCSRAAGQKPFYRKDKLQEHARKIHGRRLDELENG